MSDSQAFSSHPGHGDAQLTANTTSPSPQQFTAENNYGLKTAPGEMGKAGYLVRG